MKLRQNDGYEYSPLENAIEWGVNRNKFFWQILRAIIESLEEAHFKVSITKDGKEYNR